MNYLIAFLVAFGTNFIGMIPPGMVSLKLVSIRFEKSLRAAILFSLGVAFVEFFQTIATLRFSSLFVRFFDGNLYVKWAAVVVLLALAISFYFAKPTNKSVNNNDLKEINKKTSFIKGMILSLFNFLKYPFWIFQGIYFMKNGIIENDIFSLIIFSLGATFGSFSMYYIYINLGNKILNKFQSLANNMNKILAGFFFLLATIQFFNIFYS